MTDFRPIRPFDIDAGELGGLTPQEVFVLGYELALVDLRIEAGAPFETLIHADNCSRIEAELKRRGRAFRTAWMPDDPGECWMMLYVGELGEGSQP